MAFVLPNTLLRVTTFIFIRKYILENCKILQIVDLGPNIFEDVVMSSIILILEKNNKKK